MAESVYRVWLDEEKMCRYRQAYQQAKDHHELIIKGSIVLFTFIFVVLMFSVYEVFKTSVYFFITIFSFFCWCKGMEMIHSRLPDFLHQHSTACCDWTQPHNAKAFGDKFVKRAVKAGCEPQTAVDAMVPFLAEGDISYGAFDGYCRERQKKADKQAADEADQERQRQYRQRYEKAAGHLQKKFLTPADGTAGQ